MNPFSVKQTMIKGITLALPLAMVLYVLIKIVGMLEKMIGPLAKKAGVANILGDITITVIDILLLLLLVFLLGLLMQLAFVASFRTYIQDWIIKLVPSLNHLNLIAAEQLDIEKSVTTWRPVLVEKEGHFSPAFIIEESEEWLTLVYVKPPLTDPEIMLIIKKNEVNCKEITMKQMMQFNKQFGKGYLSLIDGGKGNTTT